MSSTCHIYTLRSATVYVWIESKSHNVFFSSVHSNSVRYVTFVMTLWLYTCNRANKCACARRFECVDSKQFYLSIVCIKYNCFYFILVVSSCLLDMSFWLHTLVAMRFFQFVCLLISKQHFWLFLYQWMQCISFKSKGERKTRRIQIADK